MDWKFDVSDSANQLTGTREELSFSRNFQLELNGVFENVNPLTLNHFASREK